MPLFGKKPTVQEQLKQNDREMRKTDRDLARDRNQLEKQEKQLQMDIKSAAKRGDQATARVLAKQLVNLRKQKNKSYCVGSKIKSINAQSKMMASNMKMADAMGKTTKTMQQMNKVMDPEKTMKVLQDFEKESMKMEMSEDMMNDTFDDLFEESGDEAEQDAIVNQVLDEIGLDISGRLADAPVARGRVGESSKTSDADADLERQLAELKAL
ncbi:charged multivesicular body protein 2b-like [Lineus longissimus]|uniref:charged multivesicular body protein 2b-like n=1 Tax=Lineus longissimus TaxID=88925 RepID=UPI002B4CA4D2